MTINEVERLASADPVERLMAVWGLPRGRVVRGWTVSSVTRLGLETALVAFARGDDVVEVRIRPSSEKPRYARIGGLDLEHSHIDESLTQEVGLLVRVLLAWLSRHGSGASLRSLLAPPKTELPPIPAADSASTTPQSSEPEVDPKP